MIQNLVLLLLTVYLGLIIGTSLKMKNTYKRKINKVLLAFMPVLIIIAGTSVAVRYMIKDKKIGSFFKIYAITFTNFPLLLATGTHEFSYSKKAKGVKKLSKARLTNSYHECRDEVLALVA